MSGAVPERNTDDATCVIPLCPALPESGSLTCGPHRDAILAKMVYSTGKPCRQCRRSISRNDHVLKADPTLHVQCEPVTPRQSREALRESEKPLFPREP